MRFWGALMADIRVVQTRPVEVNRDIVEVLEKALERAKVGELKALAVVTVNQDGTTSRSWSTNDCSSTLVGGLQITTQRLIDSLQHSEW